MMADTAALVVDLFLPEFSHILMIYALDVLQKTGFSYERVLPILQIFTRVSEKVENWDIQQSNVVVVSIFGNKKISQLVIKKNITNRLS